jgi:putative membrane protein
MDTPEPAARPGPGDAFISEPPSEPSEPPGPQRLHPLTILFGLAGAAVGFALESLSTGFDPLATLIGAFGALRVVGWFVHTYELRADEIVVVQGVFTRRRQVVPYRRVQQVDIHRGLVAQIFGLTELRIDTAGSAEGRIDLAYLDRATADSVREHVLARRATPAVAVGGAVPRDGSEPKASDPEVELLRLGVGDLARATLTGPVGVWGIAAVVVSMVIAVAAGFGTGRPLIGVAVIWIGLFGALGTTGLAVGGSILEHARFAVTRRGDDLAVSYGLLQVQHLTVPRRRVQAVSITTTPLRDRFGLASVTLHSAAAPGGQNRTAFTIPAVAAARLDELLAEVWNQPGFVAPPLTPRPAAARRRAIVRRVALCAVPGIVTTIVWFPAGAVALVLAAAGHPWGRLAHTRAGHGYDTAHAVLARGALVHRIDIASRTRLQSARTTTSPLQRRVDLTTIHFDLAGLAPRLADVDSEIGASLRRTVTG